MVIDFEYGDVQQSSVNPVIESFLSSRCGFDRSHPTVENEKAFNLMLGHLYYVQNRPFCRQNMLCT